MIQSITADHPLPIEIFKAIFRLSRVQYRVQVQDYNNKSEFTKVEIDELLFLTHLVKKGVKTIDKMEGMYQKLLWRYFSIFIILSLLFQLAAVIIEVS